MICMMISMMMCDRCFLNNSTVFRAAIYAHVVLVAYRKHTEPCINEQVLSASLQRLVLIDVPWRDVRALVVHGAAAAPSLRVLEVTQSSEAVAPDPVLAQASPVPFEKAVNRRSRESLAHAQRCSGSCMHAGAAVQSGFCPNDKAR